MNLKRFYILCLLLALAPAAAFAQAPPPPPPIPSRPMHRPRILSPTNAPAVNAAGTTAPARTTPAPAAAAKSRNTINGNNANNAANNPANKTATDGLAPGTLNAQEGANINADNTVIYNFPETPIGQVLDIYADLIGRTLLRASQGPSAVPPTTMISLKTQRPLTKADAIVALETVLGMNGITIVPIGDKFAKVVVEQSAPSAGGAISTNTVASLPEAGKFITEIVTLKYAMATELQAALVPFAKSQSSIIAIPSTQTLILRDYSENVKRMMEMVEKIDVLTPLVIKPEVIPIKYALASDIAAALSALGASGGTSVGKSSSGANFQPHNSSSASTPGGGMGGTPGSPGYSAPGQPTQSSSPLNSPATGARSAFGNNLQRVVNSAGGGGGNGQFTLFGQTKIIADERTNSLLVFANDEDMKMIKDIIAKLDVVLAQVLIEAIVLEVNLTDTRSTGVSYLQQQKQYGNIIGQGGVNNLSSSASSFLNGGTSSSTGTNGTPVTSTASNPLTALPGGFSYFAKFGNDLDVVLEAVASDSRVNVLSRPRIQTSHAVPADLFIGNTVPYVTGTYNYGYGSGPSSQYTEKEVGIRLQVLPLINPDGLVVMDIQQDIEQLGPPVTIAGVGDVPTTTKREAGAKVAVKTGETVILGGFISASRTKSNSGVPWLKDLPVLGALFRSSSLQNLRTELIVLMRPTVLPTPEIAAQVATREKNKMSGVKQAELDMREDERKRNAIIEVELAKEAKQKAADAKNRKFKDLDVPEDEDTSTNSVPQLQDLQ